MSFFAPTCYRCGHEFKVGEKAEIITVGTINSVGRVSVEMTERRVLVCEAPCV